MNSQSFGGREALGLARQLAFQLTFTVVMAAQQVHSGPQVSQFQGNNQECSLQVDFSAQNVASAQQHQPVGSLSDDDLNNYSLFSVLNPDTAEMRVCDVSHDYLDSARPMPVCGADPAPAPACSGSRATVQHDSNSLTLPLIRPLHASAHYILVIHGLDGNKVESAFTNSTSLITPDMAARRTRLKIVSTFSLTATKDQPVTISRKTVLPNGTSRTDNYPAIVESVEADGIFLQMASPLPQTSSGSLQLTVVGISDYYKTPVSIAGKITVSSAPPVPNNGSSSTQNNSNSFVSVQLNAVAAVHSTPTLSATGAIAPWHPAVRALFLPWLIQFDPAVNFDVGSANAKSTNSVIVPSSFSRSFIPNPQSAHPLAALADFGPRAEFDTAHGGVNLLGEGRGELYLPFLSQSESSQTAKVAAGNPSIRDTLPLPSSGFSIVPYLQGDFGGHVTSQTISNPSPNPTVSVPTFDISRLYLGTYGTIQFGRSTITLDGAWFDMFTRESAVYSGKNNVVHELQVTGWQPHVKGTYSLYLDPTKHFGVSLSWEDGRSAPTFQYINKATGGIQVTY